MSKWSLVAQILHISTITYQFPLLLHFQVLIPSQLCETPILAHDNLLSTWELVLGSAERFNRICLVTIQSTDRNQYLPNANSSNNARWLSPCAAHAGLQSICASYSEHLIDANNMEWVRTDT